MRTCVAERIGYAHNPLGSIWHITDGEDPDAWFQPILCGGGISARGHLEDREPDCPECVRLATTDSSPEETV